jgi:UDPglucose 6-dehydrogenase
MKKISQENLANTIITSRKSLNMTQAQLSEATGINRTMLSHLESGE